jgi:predicted ATPase
VLSPNVTLVVGENNSGKSTLLQSIISVQQQPIGPEYVRYGKPDGKIRVERATFNALQFHATLRDAIRNTTNADSIVALEATFPPPANILETCDMVNTP